MISKEVTREEDLYYQGAFWIVGKSLDDILSGNFEIVIGSKLLTDYYGDYAEKHIPKKSALTHAKLWKGNSVSWDYYPRGRVAIDHGTAYIHINSKCATKEIIDAIVDEYEIGKLRIVRDYNNEYQGSHYDFKLS